MKIVQLSRPPIHLVHLRPILFHPLDLGRPILKEPPHHHLSPNDNQSTKIKYNPRMTIYVIRSFLQVDFRCQYHLINLFRLSFDFFSFSWSVIICFFVAYTLVCAIVQKYHEISFIYIYSHFSTHFVINLFYLHNLKT